MVVPFGFSAGDFVSVIGLVVKVGKALRSTDGASAEYQQIEFELSSLKRTLEIIQALQPSPHNAAHINAIRCLALSCRLPLNGFLEKIAKFERNLGSFSQRTALRSVGRKAQWTLTMADEVQRFRTVIAAKVLSLNLLLSLQNTELLSRVEAQTSQALPALVDKLQSMAVDQTTMAKAIADQGLKLNKASYTQEKLCKDLSDSNKASTSILNDLRANAASTHTAVINLNHSWGRFLETIKILPQEFRAMLQRIALSNFEMYGMLRNIQTTLSRSPYLQINDSISFEDALGRPKLLPYQFFKHFDVFDRFLRHEFNGLPGEDRIIQGQYVLLHAQYGGAEITPEDWAMIVYPGSKVNMSVIMEALYAGRTNRCSRIGCPGTLSVERGGFRQCNCCPLCVASVSRALPEPLIPENGSTLTGLKPDFQTHDKVSGANAPRKAVVANQHNPEFEDEDAPYAIDPVQLQRHKAELNAFKRVHFRGNQDTPLMTRRPLVYLDIGTASVPLGRIIIQLFADSTPGPASAFQALCSAEGRVGESGKLLRYQGTCFESARAFTGNSAITGGCLANSDDIDDFQILHRQTDKSGIKLFFERPFLVSKSVLETSMRFFINTTSSRIGVWNLNIIGQVVHGRPVVRAIQHALSQESITGVRPCIVTDCGEFDGPITFTIPDIPRPSRPRIRETRSSTGRLMKISCPAYHLPQSVLQQWLTRKFPEIGTFNVSLSNDKFVFNIPRKLTEAELLELHDERYISGSENMSFTHAVDNLGDLGRRRTARIRHKS